MNKVYSYSLLLFLIFGCSSNPINKNPSSLKSSIVFGYIDSSNAGSALDYISYRRQNPDTLNDVYYPVVEDDGLFYMADVPPGRYKVIRLSGGADYYNFDDRVRNTLDFNLMKQQVRFLGSYKLKINEKGFMEADRFYLVPTNKPTQKELLRKLMKKTKNKAWLSILRRKLNLIK